MLKEKLKNHNLILASGSPRRQQFFKELDLDFTIQLKPVDETFPDHLQGAEITDYLAKLKAAAFTDLQATDILVTSDTIVWFNGVALNKPEDRDEAYAMIAALSGNSHEVITSVAFTTKESQTVINDTTTVTFKELTEEEINYYIDNYQSYDKAGGYGIQEWFGYIAVTRLKGSYFNVMGMPLHKVYETLMQLAE
ncbi:Maf-like protein [Dokdonia donghaensis]|uniref:dTTP/UTP pyrophosphatase n=1 Tax=Dokdonia donghaensis DSW-1 TaxID=1300343 RepID=A0A0A2GUN7_9FLAO|nr:Maf-like protein [Dokdonia donghaensis]ANH60700.1 Septum formation protein Maf [Dokdonia donghaensis DSW-1]KGO06026.1 septum formation inhibitor Maf [Dokdonia donghaensis DSW-1]